MVAPDRAEPRVAALSHPHRQRTEPQVNLIGLAPAKRQQPDVAVALGDLDAVRVRRRDRVARKVAHALAVARNPELPRLLVPSPARGPQSSAVGPSARRDANAALDAPPDKGRNGHQEPLAHGAQPLCETLCVGDAGGVFRVGVEALSSDLCFEVCWPPTSALLSCCPDFDITILAVQSALRRDDEMLGKRAVKRCRKGRMKEVGANRRMVFDSERRMPAKATLIKVNRTHSSNVMFA